MGGAEEFSMGHLDYTSYDPAFYVQLATADRIVALWQELQKYRLESFASPFQNLFYVRIVVVVCCLTF